MSAELLPGEAPRDLSPGDRVAYVHSSRGGYGLLVTTPAVVMRKTPTGRYTVRLQDGRAVTVARSSLLDTNWLEEP